MSASSQQLNLDRLISDAINGEHFSTFKFNSTESLLIWSLLFPSLVKYTELIELFADGDYTCSEVREACTWLVGRGLVIIETDADLIRITDSGTAAITETPCGDRPFIPRVLEMLEEPRNNILLYLDKRRYVSRANLYRFFTKMPGSTFQLTTGDLLRDNTIYEFLDPNVKANHQIGFTLSDEGYTKYKGRYLSSIQINSSVRTYLASKKIKHDEFYRALLRYLFDAAGQLYQTILQKELPIMNTLEEILGSKPKPYLSRSIREYFDAPLPELHRDERYRFAHYLFSLAFLYIMQADTEITFASYFRAAPSLHLNILLDTNVLISLISSLDRYHYASQQILDSYSKQHADSVTFWVTNRTLTELMKVARSRVMLLANMQPFFVRSISEAQHLLGYNSMFMMLLDGITRGQYASHDFVKHVRSELHKFRRSYNLKLLEMAVDSPFPLLEIECDKGAEILRQYEQANAIKKRVRDFLGGLMEDVAIPLHIRDMRMVEALKDNEYGNRLYKLLEEWALGALDRLSHKVYLLRAANILHTHIINNGKHPTQVTTFVWTYQWKFRDYRTSLTSVYSDDSMSRVTHGRQVATLLNLIHNPNPAGMVRFAIESENEYNSSLSLGINRNMEHVRSVLHAYGVDLVREWEFTPGIPMSVQQLFSTVIQNADHDMAKAFIHNLVDTVII